MPKLCSGDFKVHSVKQVLHWHEILTIHACLSNTIQSQQLLSHGHIHVCRLYMPLPCTVLSFSICFLVRTFTMNIKMETCLTSFWNEKSCKLTPVFHSPLFSNIIKYFPTVHYFWVMFFFCKMIACYYNMYLHYFILL